MVTRETSAAILARASTEHQGDTCEHQIMALQAWAQRLSTPAERFRIAPDHIFVDEGVSAWKESILERPAVKRFIQAVERADVRCLFIKGLSRFNRDDAEAKMFFEWLDGKGVRVKSLEEGFDSQEKGGAMAIFHVHSFLARLESDKKSIATKIGMREKMKKGEWKGGIPPYGYRYDPERRKLVPIQALKPLLIEIFALAAAGRGAVWIAHHFNQTGKWHHVDPRAWTATSIQRILARRVYVGDLVCGIHNYRYTRTLERSRAGGYLFGKKRRVLERAPEEEAIVVPDAHEPIISRALFAEVEAQLRLRRARAGAPGHSPAGRYPLTGLLTCGQCGGPMIHHGRNHARGYRYYTCATKFRKGRSVCDQRNVRADHLHELLLLLLAERLERLDVSSRFWADYQLIERPRAVEQRRLAALEAEVTEAADTLAETLLATLDLPAGVRQLLVQRTEEKIQRLRADQRRLVREAAEAEAAQVDRDALQETITAFSLGGLQLRPDDDPAALRELFHHWFLRVVIGNGGPKGRREVLLEWRGQMESIGHR